MDDSKIKELLRYNTINDENVESLKNEIANLKSAIQNVSNSIRQNDASLLNINGRISSLDSQFACSNFICSENASLLKALQTQQQDAKKSVDEQLKKHQDNIFRLQESVDFLTSEINKTCYIIKQANSLFDELKKQAQNHENDCIDKFDYLKKEHSKDIVNLTKKIDSIHIPDVSPFITRDEINDLKREFNLCNLDSKNANMRCVNIESEISMLSKRMQNLQIVLKSMELGVSESGK